ncbi:MAG: hypothetical protein GYA31_01570 [Parcubacteria group bacterium]|nr:hypothetical protein [Parcubacteria group bacterium]
MDEESFKNWKFFQDISKQLRDLGFRLILISMKGLAFPKLRYTREELLGKKEIRAFVKMIKKMKEKEQEVKYE